MQRAAKFKPYDTIYNSDRWRVPGEKDIYFVTVHQFNGVGHWELYHVPKPHDKPELILFALGDCFAVQFKLFYNANPLKKIRTPKRDRIGPSLFLYGLTH